ncbi:hypothetical protein DV711_12535 [Motiliproteus coralliicola]|uniref:Uncharacterized protein n=1 Tax=Motiliproteus coralliicola TaxID=2283196 RepID=A0A369WED7_9GAMM|nr:hypothetical protein [Motiliproteus coralliicola]RDE19701.1 hypothetical protein DV711_12535 [Motiliproteus coralliicola]
MIRPLVTVPRPLYRLALIQLLSHPPGLRAEETSNLLQQLSARLQQRELLVICANVDGGAYPGTF